MILVTLGTQKQSFERLLKYVENASIDSEVIVQKGKTEYVSNKMKVFNFITYDEMSKYIDKADVIITHGGTGSVIGPLRKGKKIIACARLSKYDEHVDDHQTELVSVFASKGYILELNEDNDLTELLEEAKGFKPKKFKSNSEDFLKKLREEIEK